MDKDKFINVDDPDRPEVFEGEFGDKYFDCIAEDDDGKPHYVKTCPTSVPRFILITLFYILVKTFQMSH